MNLAPANKQIVHCVECGAENVLPANRCWLCYKLLQPGEGVIAADVVDGPTAELHATEPPPQLPVPKYPVPPAPMRDTPTSQWVFGIMTGAVFVLIVLVGLGIAVDQSQSSLLMVYLAIVLPGLLTTGISLLRSHAKTGQVSWQRGFLTFVLTLALSFGVAVVVIAMLVIAAIIAFLNFCFGSLSGH